MPSARCKCGWTIGLPEGLVQTPDCTINCPACGEKVAPRKQVVRKTKAAATEGTIGPETVREKFCSGCAQAVLIDATNCPHCRTNLVPRTFARPARFVALALFVVITFAPLMPLYKVLGNYVTAIHFIDSSNKAATLVVGMMASEDADLKQARQGAIAFHFGALSGVGLLGIVIFVVFRLRRVSGIISLLLLAVPGLITIPAALKGELVVREAWIHGTHLKVAIPISFGYYVVAAAVVLAAIASIVGIIFPEPKKFP